MNAIKISLNFVPKGPINNISALVHIMAWRRPGDKPLSESMMLSLLTHICVTQPHPASLTIRAVIQHSPLKSRRCLITYVHTSDYVQHTFRHSLVHAAHLCLLPPHSYKLNILILIPTAYLHTKVALWWMIYFIADWNVKCSQPNERQ